MENRLIFLYRCVLTERWSDAGRYGGKADGIAFLRVKRGHTGKSVCLDVRPDG